MKDFSALISFATDRQKEIIQAVIEEGGIRAAARKLNMTHGAVQGAIKRAEAARARTGYQPEEFGPQAPLPEPYLITNGTLQVNGEGQVERHWPRYKMEDAMAEQAIMKAIEDRAETIKPLPKIKVPRTHDKDLLTMYTITDFHLGAYAWAAETGDDWDVDIAERVLLAAVEEMVEGSPASHTAILNQLGDFLHWDGILAVTPTSGHVLDADTRFEKLADLALSVIEKAVEIIARKHKRVVVWNCEGNHDIAASAWLRVSISRIFKNNPRIEVDTTPFPYYAHLHGEILLGAHHGHKKKMKDLPGVFASEPRYRELWGKSKVAYIHTGHMHHEKKIEDAGAIVEQHPTLAARDSYAARGGWTSWRSAKAITYHVQKGEYSRKCVTPSE